LKRKLTAHYTEAHQQQFSERAAMTKANPCKLTLLEILNQAFSNTKVSDEEIARKTELSSSAVRLIRSGKMKVPLQSVSKLAVIAGLDVAYLMRVALDEYQPGLLAQIEELIGGTLLSAAEKRLVDSFRYIARGADAEAVLIDRAAVVAIVTT
jgi:transcriptional regulator with XRE-family HTH domain